MSRPYASRLPEGGAGRAVTATIRRSNRTLTDRQLAVFEASNRLEALSVVLAADLIDHGCIDGDTGAWAIGMVDTAARWIAQMAA